MKWANEESHIPRFPSIRMRIAIGIMVVYAISALVLRVAGEEPIDVRFVQWSGLLGWIIPFFYLLNVLVFSEVKSALKYIAYPAWILVQALFVIFMPQLLFPGNRLAVVLSAMLYGVPMWIATKSELNYLRARDLALSRLGEAGVDRAATKHQVLYQALIGKTGRTLTPLALSGRVLVEGDKYAARSEREYIDAGQTVKVVGANGFGLIVQLAEDGETPAPNAS
jgi:membrane protein implicated in regulation of membrane protease activity